MVTAKHSASSPKADGLLKKILSPRTALKILFVGMLSYAAQMLLIPDYFLRMNFVGEKTGLVQFFMLICGLRELLLALIALAIAIQGSDSLCRTTLTLAFMILSPAQTYMVATSSLILDNARMFMFIVQALFAIYLCSAVLNSWKPSKK